MLRSMIFTLLFACTGSEDDSKVDDTGDTAGDTGPALEVAPEPFAYSGGTCPALVDGDNDGFLSAEKERSFILKLPENPEGAPVLFLWHWLGGSATQALRVFDYNRLPEDEGIIVVAPESCCDTFEWQFMTPPEDNVDLVFFDDLLSCLDQQFQIDRDRVWATGMSAGGLWTTYLTIHRASWLVSTAIFSGGTDPVIDYETPPSPIPVMLTWGGPTDLYAVLSFEEASLAFEAQIEADGSFVVPCVHDGGHTIPSGGPEAGLEFLMDHPRNAVPEPYADGLPSDFPDYCALAQPAE